jgi:para-nitrobenzyl esterase
MRFERSRRAFIKQGALFVALSSGGLLLKPAHSQARAVEAETTFGRVRGTDFDGIKTFKGIPYGASTAGKNRFMPPLDPEKWSGVRDALAYGRSAPQREPGVQVRSSGLAVAAAGLPAEGEDARGR